MERDPRSETPTTPGTPAPQAPVEATRGERIRHRARQVRFTVWTAILVAALVGLIIFVASNTRHVKISWLVWSTRGSLVWILLVAGALGWIVGLATGFLFWLRTRRR